jgi:hypothetical protein
MYQLLTMMIKEEHVSETLVFSSTTTWLIAQDNFNEFICCESFKS